MKEKKRRPGSLGIIGETAAKLLFHEKGWNPFTHFIDEDKVDLILRRSRGNKPEYREIQVKYRRLYDNRPSRWARKLFLETIKYDVKADEFKNRRKNFFVLFVFGYPQQAIEKDVLLFPSKDLHQIIKKTYGTKAKVLYISKALDGKRWLALRKRRKFHQINHKTCQDVSRYLNNFKILG